MKIKAHSIVVIVTIVLCTSVALSQVRQTELYIDDSSGNFTILKASHGGGTVTMPSGTGTLSFGSDSGAGGVNLQASTPGTAQTGNINVDGTIVADSIASSGGITAGSLTSPGSIAAKSITATGAIGGGNITATGKLAVTGTTTLTSLTANVYVDNTGTYACDSRSTPDFTVVEKVNGGGVVLPSSPAAGRIIAVKFADNNGGHSMTVLGNGLPIDGSSNYTLNGYGGSQPSGIIVVNNGAGTWSILASQH